MNDSAGVHRPGPAAPGSRDARSPAGVGADVTVVIPTFNRSHGVERALRALADQTAQGFAVVVVDNSSTDDTQERMAAQVGAWAGRLAYVRKVPEGPASARNVGLDAARSSYVLFHDSDVELPPDWLERALAHMAADPALGVVGGYLLYGFDPGRVNAYGGDLGRMGLAWDFCEGTPLDATQGPVDRIWINCSVILVRAQPARAAGGFDGRFFYGFEDSDFGWRLCLAGHRSRVFPDLIALHHVDANPGLAHAQMVFHYCKNRLCSMIKNAAGAHLPWMLAGYLSYTLADLALRAPRRSKLAALMWNLRNLRETLALRRAVQATRTITDREVFALGSGRWFPAVPLAGRRRRPDGSTRSSASDSAAADDRL